MCMFVWYALQKQENMIVKTHSIDAIVIILSVVRHYTHDVYAREIGSGSVINVLEICNKHPRL